MKEISWYRSSTPQGIGVFPDRDCGENGDAPHQIKYDEKQEMARTGKATNYRCQRCQRPLAEEPNTIVELIMNGGIGAA